MNIIILEGPDGAGKSTMAAILAEKGYQRQNFGVPPEEIQGDEEQLFRFFLDPLIKAEVAGGRYVFDRLHLSDRIYAPLMRGGTAMTYRAEALIERYTEAIDAQIVICLPPRREAFQNWLKRKEIEYVPNAKTYHLIYNSYVKLLFNAKRNRHFVWYDYTRHFATSMVNALVGLSGLPLNQNMVGSQKPRFLFICDEPGTWLPLMTTRGYPGWFFNTLQEAGYQEHEMAFVNTNGADGQVERALSRLGKVHVITLGGVANDIVVNKTDILPYPLDHPLEAMDFTGSKRLMYTAQLKNIRRGVR